MEVLFQTRAVFREAVGSTSRLGMVNSRHNRLRRSSQIRHALLQARFLEQTTGSTCHLTPILVLRGAHCHFHRRRENVGVVKEQRCRIALGWQYLTRLLGVLTTRETISFQMGTSILRSVVSAEILSETDPTRRPTC